MEALEAEAKEAHDEARMMGITLKTPLSASLPARAAPPDPRRASGDGGETLLEHLEASDVLGECAAEKASRQ